jgi:opacity protein-like surface antigen
MPKSEVKKGGKRFLKKPNHNFMKKILIATTLAASLASASALAKTEGNYVGFDVLRANVKVKSNSDDPFDQAFNSAWYSHSKTDSATGFGVNYRYAFNMNNFFIAPGAFFEYIGADAKVNHSETGFNSYTQSVKINDRYGVKLDLGYDITDKFSAYVPVGVSSVGYEIKTSDSDGAGDFVKTRKSGNKFNYFYGFGISFVPAKNFLVSLEYNKLSQLKLSSVSSATLPNGGTIKANVNADIVKLGVSYNF